jgi:putative cell wall-binding protein
VYIATGEDFPDALAGAVAAAHDRAPILLVTRDRVPASVASELQRLDPNTLVLLGGTAAIASSVKSDLESLTGASVQRLAGGDRYATAAAISAASFGSDTRVVFVTTGNNFPDAVAGAPAAHRLGAPMLLLQSDTVPLPTALELDRLRPEIIVILGGEAAISEDGAEELEGYGTGSTSLPLVTLERP